MFFVDDNIYSRQLTFVCIVFGLPSD